MVPQQQHFREDMSAVYCINIGRRVIRIAADVAKRNEPNKRKQNHKVLIQLQVGFHQTLTANGEEILITGLVVISVFLFMNSHALLYLIDGLVLGDLRSIQFPLLQPIIG